jgi:hypothetical protein
LNLLTAVVLASMTFQVDDPQHMHMGASMEDAAQHRMYSYELANGARIVGMAQAFPIATFGFADEQSPLDDRGFYLTQPAAMVNVESPSRRFVLRLTPNFEGLTQEDGELTFGGWGEGFIDSRHPHTLLHEVMLSVNLWDTSVGSLSLSGGKGFAPYGTDDPMARPSVKYPTNHHLSQILERFTLNAAWVSGPWSLEAGLFGGAEPEGPYDLSNVESFGDSWSARATRRFGAVQMGQAVWEVGASFAQVTEEHHGEAGGEPESETTDLFNTSLRLDAPLSGGRHAYGLIEFSRSYPEHDEGYWSLLAEGSLRMGRHTPYLRFERATRPEYPREGDTGDAFFRYDHDAEPIGATAWSIVSIGYGFTATNGFVSVRPFVEGQFHSAAGERGGVSALDVLGDQHFAALTLGARVFFGGDPMRMGSYGVLDPMTRMGR